MLAVFLNPRAGGAGSKDLRTRLERLFCEAGVEAQITLLHPGLDPVEAAGHAARTAAAVVAAGGDGEDQCRRLRSRSGTAVPLGVLPLGTLNHFARDLGLPLGLKQAVTAIAGGRRVAVDVGRLNDRTFLNNASIGVYPNIVELRDQLQRLGHGRLGALVSATGKVLRSYRGVSVELTSESGRWAGRTPFVFVGNNGIHRGRPQAWRAAFADSRPDRGVCHAAAAVATVAAAVRAGAGGPGSAIGFVRSLPDAAFGYRTTDGGAGSRGTRRRSRHAHHAFAFPIGSTRAERALSRRLTHADDCAPVGSALRTVR